MQKVAIVIPNLAGGGAERVACSMANYWVSCGASVTFATLAPESTAKSFYKMPVGVKAMCYAPRHKGMNLLSKISRIVNRIFWLRKVIKDCEPDIIVSHLCPASVSTIISALGLKRKIIVYIHNDPRKNVPHLNLRILRFILYRFAWKIAVLTPEVKYECAINWKTLEDIVIVKNPLDSELWQEHASLNEIYDSAPRRFIAGMGRLVYIKGFDRLISAFAQIAPVHPAVDLVIVGMGPERESLYALTKSYGLTARIHFLGAHSRPWILLKGAELFVLTSRSEGFGNVLIEAMANGICCVSFDCESGPRQIIKDGVNGYLVQDGDVNCLAGIIDRLLSDSSERARIARNGLAARDDYDIKKVMRVWDSLLKVANSISIKAI